MLPTVHYNMGGIPTNLRGQVHFLCLRLSFRHSEACPTDTACFLRALPCSAVQVYPAPAQGLQCRLWLVLFYCTLHVHVLDFLPHRLVKS